jgi:hypothetical protein
MVKVLSEECIRLQEQRFAVMSRLTEIERAMSTMRRVPESLTHEYDALVQRHRKLLDEWDRLGCGAE